MRCFFHDTPRDRYRMLDPFDSSHRSAIPLVIHYTRVQRNMPIAVRIGPQTHATVDRRFGDLYPGFHRIERASPATQHLPGALIGVLTRIPGRNDDRLSRNDPVIRMADGGHSGFS